jgi:HD-like signal output (HDOD) protein
LQGGVRAAAALHRPLRRAAAVPARCRESAAAGSRWIRRRSVAALLHCGASPQVDQSGAHVGLQRLRADFLPNTAHGRSAMTDTLLRSLEEFRDHLDFDRLQMPSMPEVALRVQQLAGDPNANLDALSGIISQGAALSARMIRVANSPLMNPQSNVRSVSQAVFRLGFGPVCNIALAFALQQASKVHSSFAVRELKKTWTESREVAAISSALAKFSRKLPSDQALLAGMVHRIGVLPLLVQLDPLAVQSEEAEDAVAAIEELHAEIGGRILRNWGFAEDLASVPEQYRDPCRSDVARADLSDVVAVAAVIHKVASGRSEWLPPLDSFESGMRLGLNCSIEALQMFSESELVAQGRQLVG